MSTTKRTSTLLKKQKAKEPKPKPKTPRSSRKKSEAKAEVEAEAKAEAKAEVEAEVDENAVGEKKPKAKAVAGEKKTKAKAVAGEKKADDSIVEDEKKSKRKINMNPTLSEKSGLNISVARVKNIVDVFILNKDEYDAAREVRSAHRTPSKDAEGKVIKDNEGKVVYEPSVPIKSLSEGTRALIQKAKHFHDRFQKEEWERTFVSKMSEDNKAKYYASRKVAKDTFENNMRIVPEFERGVFDVESFNLSYDKEFYKGFIESKTSEDEWSVALGYLSKLRVRFSANSKILLSSFIELIICQIAINGTYKCIQGKKKIIKLDHALDFTHDDTNNNFSLFPLITNTKAYRNFRNVKSKESLENEVEEVVDEMTLDADELEESEEANSRPNFRFYVSEICRDVRMKLASKTLKIEGDSIAEVEVYNLTNVSRDFKDFCNELIFEIVAILGRMILTEINTRGVKTLNDVIMKTVIEHLHSAYGIDFKPSLLFIEQSTTKYNTFVRQRRETRKVASDESDKNDDYNVDYVEE